MGGSAYINGYENKVFDNFYKCSFIYKNKIWTSSEQAYQAMKFEDEEYRERIRNEDKIGIIYFLGQNKYIKRTSKWETDETSEKKRLMYEINTEKIFQNKELIDILLFTGNEEIYYIGDRFWGKKGKNGLNCGGNILMQIRDELRQMYFI